VATNLRNETKSIAVPTEWQCKVTNLISGEEMTLGEMLELKPFEYLICKK
jgi:hypothetical protein